MAATVSNRIVTPPFFGLSSDARPAGNLVWVGASFIPVDTGENEVFIGTGWQRLPVPTLDRLLLAQNETNDLLRQVLETLNLVLGVIDDGSLQDMADVDEDFNNARG